MNLIHRPRRLRRNETVRRMVRETTLTPNDLIYPLFAVPGEGVKKPVGAMPGVFQLSVDGIVAACKEAAARGIPAVILFGIPDHKDAEGTGAYDDNGIIQQAVAAVKSAVPDLAVITDVCLCEYTDHGHCGVIKDGDVNNDATVELLVREAVSHARAGADMVAPSDMMDGRVGAIRAGLDREGFTNTPIMSYSSKFASAYYGPFREAAESVPQFGDRKSYQMDPANGREAVRETMLDLAEGADIVMVKPALAYLDVLRQIKDRVDVPVAAYNVSGEYSMVKAAAEKGWIDGDKVMLETLLSMRRAGADLILTYHALEAAELLG